MTHACVIWLNLFKVKITIFKKFSTFFLNFLKSLPYILTIKVDLIFYEPAL